MEPTCLRQSELPGSSRLFLDYVYDYERVARFYRHAPYEEASYRAAAEFDFPAERRAAITAALAEQNEGSPLIGKLAQPGTVVVVTGQQVGLFGGPCYTLYKALTAVALARRLSERGLTAVPVFWLATEDHDFEEVRWSAVFDARMEPVRLETTADGTGRRPVGRIRVDAPVAELRAALEGMPFARDAAAIAERAYPSGTSLGEGFARLLRELLGPREMLLLDPLQPPIRRVAAPFLKEVAGRAAELSARVRERGAELESAGYHAQVLVEPENSLLFLLEGGERIPLRLSDGALAARFQERPERLSPNALLRPVMQDFLLPTVGYVGGPAEIAYFAQSEVLYRALLGRMPVAVPRRGFTVVDARAGKLLDRYGLKLTDLFGGDAAVRERIAAQLVPAGIKEALGGTRARVEELLTGLGGELQRFDPTLAEAFARSRRKMAYQMEKTERKAAREALRRDERAQAEAAYLSGLVYPEKHLQERFYSVLPFVARWGTGLMERLDEEVAHECRDHRVIVA